MEIILLQKQCARCRLVLEIGLFKKNRTQKDGFCNWCKSCCKSHNEVSKDQINRYRRERYKKKKEQILATNRKYYILRHGDPTAKRTRRTDEERKQAARNSRKLWNLKRFAYSSELRARKAGVDDRRISKVEWMALCERFGNICLRCRQSKKLTIDHIIPLSLGGGNSMDNLQPLCLSCNCSKGDNAIDYRW